MGAPTSAPTAEGVSQQEQARQTLDGLRKAAETSYSGPAFTFCIRDTNTANQSNREDTFGVLTTDWQSKIAATVLAG